LTKNAFLLPALQALRVLCDCLVIFIRMSNAPQVVPVTESALPAVAAFTAAQARAGEAVTEGALSPLDRLRWVLLENPARTIEIPLGWCVKDGDAVVGTLLCVPFRAGAEGFQCTALMASKFYVDPRYRGMGIAPMMRFLQEGRRFPLLMTSANALAGEIYRKCGAFPLEGMDHTMLGVARPGPLAEEWVARRTGSQALAQVLSLPAKVVRRRIRASTQGSELATMGSAEEATTPALPRPQEVMAIIRDADYVRWRYFGREGKDVYRLRVAGQEDRLVVVRRVRSGRRSQIRVLDVLDVWPAASPLAAERLVGHLAARYAGRFDVIWLRSQPPETEQALQRIGFVRHGFPAPLGWCIDRAGILPTRRWYLMPGEAE
jgi:GNAT superfamily N-acetyltransferase